MKSLKGTWSGFRSKLIFPFLTHLIVIKINVSEDALKDGVNSYKYLNKDILMFQLIVIDQ